MEQKKGYQTSEFWLSLLGTAAGIAGTVGGVIPQPWGVILATVLPAVYTIARTAAKKG
jgi:hypothetical protein